MKKTFYLVLCLGILWSLSFPVNAVEPRVIDLGRVYDSYTPTTANGGTYGGATATLSGRCRVLPNNLYDMSTGWSELSAPSSPYYYYWDNTDISKNQGEGYATATSTPCFMMQYTRYTTLIGYKTLKVSF